MFAVKVVDQIVHNRYTTAWDDLHPVDQKVAPLRRVRAAARRRSPVIAAPLSTKVVSVEATSRSGSATARSSRARPCTSGSASRAAFTLVHTVHLVAAHGKWTWILPSCRFRDYRDDKCPVDAGSTPPPATS